MLGPRSRWARWLLVLGCGIGGIRLLVGLAFPLLPEAFAWGSSIMLGTAIVFLTQPLPNEIESPPPLSPPSGSASPPDQPA